MKNIVFFVVWPFNVWQNTPLIGHVKETGCFKQQQKVLVLILPIQKDPASKDDIERT